MDKKIHLKPLAAALGTTFAVGIAVAPAAGASDNPFAAVEYASGYMVADSHGGEGNCGGNKGAEGSCGGEKKAAEGNCGGEKKAAEGNCGGEKKAAEGSCGGEKKGAEGNCGGSH